MTSGQNNVKEYGPGDWVVHAYHGVGRIKATEQKRMADKETTYFRIEMVDSIIWIPVGDIDGVKIRPVAPKKDFRQAIEVLTNEPEVMDANMNIRRFQIDKIIAENAPVSTAKLVKDMWGRQQEKGPLNETERRAYRSLSERLIQEWSVCMGIDIETARELFDQQLRLG